ncbi:MAG: hypothetical protein HFK08_07105 [Clostridia bacterium]|nr:hypothetical protein [Clostridia bacterium]
MTKRKQLIFYKVAVIGVALLFLFYPGIADKQPQIDARVMITAIGVDKTEQDKIMITAAISVASGGGESSGGKETTASAEGDDLSDAIDSLARALGKDAQLSHCGLVAFGRELCMSGVEEEVSYLVASGLISDGASVIAADGTAEEFIDGAAGLSESAAFSLGSFLSFSVENAQIPMVSLLRFASNCGSVGKGAYLPVVKMGPGGSNSGSGEQSGGQGGGQKEQGGGQDSQSQGEQGGEQGGGQKEQSGDSSGGSQEAQIASAEKALIFKDYKGVAEFDEDTTLAITWQDPQSDRGLVKLDKFEYDGENLGQFSFKMKKKGISVKAKFEEDKPVIIVKIKAQLETEDNHKLSEKQEKGFTEKQLMDALRDKLKEYIDKQIKNGWEKAKEVKVDPFKYDARLYRKNAKKYEQTLSGTDALFEKLELRTDIDLLII